MIDVVMPKNNEERLLAIAERLGFDSLCFLYEKAGKDAAGRIEGLREKTGLRLYLGGFSKGDVVFADVSMDNVENAVRKGYIDVLFGFESLKGRDSLKQKASGLDPVLCKTASERKKIYCVDFGRVLALKGRARSAVFARLRQNIALCRKYGIQIAIASFASVPLRMRNWADMSAFLSVLGHDAGKKPLEAIEERIVFNLGKSSGRIIREGIEKCQPGSY